MLVCQDCGSHRVLETGGTVPVFDCPVCGLPGTAADMRLDDQLGMVHLECHDPAPPLPVGDQTSAAAGGDGEGSPAAPAPDEAAAEA